MLVDVPNRLVLVVNRRLHSNASCKQCKQLLNIIVELLNDFKSFEIAESHLSPPCFRPGAAGKFCDLGVLLPILREPLQILLGSLQNSSVGSFVIQAIDVDLSDECQKTLLLMHQ